MLAVRIIAVSALASLLASFTDWLFMDVLVRRQYEICPEIWRSGENARRIALSQFIGTLASLATVVMCVWVPHRPVAVAATAWCVGALPVTLQQLQWMKVTPAIAASHAIGWLFRLLIAALLATWLLR